MSTGRLGWLAAALGPAIVACQPATWTFDEPTGDAGATTADGASDATVSAVDAMVARDAAWTPPDGCVGDPACLSCNPNGGSTGSGCPSNWTCNSEVARCVQCSPSHPRCPTNYACLYGRCLQTCDPGDPGTCGGPLHCNADHVCVPCLDEMDCQAFGETHCTLTGECVECTSDQHCSNKPGAPYCAFSGVAVGTCVECTPQHACAVGSCDAFGLCENGGPNGDD